MVKRILLIVLDGLGIGELPDAGEYCDIGSNTLKNMADAVGGLALPNLESLGLGYLGDFRGIGRPEKLKGSYGKMSEASKGKDTTSGHWEMMGVVVDKPFPTYPHGFPPEVITAFENAVGRKILGNKTASGTEIIKELGEEHIRTGKPIVYTSADSVFQIAAHEEVIPVEELCKICEIARGILQSPHNVGRVIARPFVGKAGSFQRTPRRKDFSLPPHKKTALEYISENGLDVVSIGKVKDIFAGRGFTKSVLVSGNNDAVSKTITYFESLERGLVWVTLVDFDTLYGHRNDPQGYAKALKDFDKKLPEILEMLTERDILIITADHGCDPTTPSTDHSREYVPLLIYGNALKKCVNLGLRTSFSDLGATALEALGIKAPVKGKSFWEEIIDRKNTL
ncbi:MAG: phosphopentomutase [Nitrospirae bacterium]|nr:phosphopentomutase [Nitrospirota bacterium]